MESLHKKLSLEKYEKITILKKPKEVTLFDNLDFKTRLSKSQDCIITFIETLEEMKNFIFEVNEKKLITHDGYLYFAYPKLDNKKGLKGIHRDEIFPYLDLDMGGDGFVDHTNLKFSRMVKLDDNYTIVGLKVFDKRPKPKKEISGRVDDYIEYIPEILNRLNKEEREYFENLTAYKQKEWARHIYSGQKEETREKRWEKLFDDIKNNR